MKFSCDFHSTGKPTYWLTDRNKIPFLIDFFIVKGISGNCIKVEEGFDLSSDHSPIIMTINEALNKKVEPARLTKEKTNWDAFKKNIEANVALSVSLKTPYELEVEVDRFVDILLGVGWKNAPKQKKKPTSFLYT